LRGKKKKEKENKQELRAVSLSPTSVTKTYIPQKACPFHSLNYTRRALANNRTSLFEN
jgi:hypothetical protein